MPPIAGQTHRAQGSQRPNPPPFSLPPSLWSLCPPSSPSSVVGGGPAPSCPAPFPLVPLATVSPTAPPARRHSSCLPSSLLWVTVTWPVCPPVCTLFWLASLLLCSNWLDCTCALFASSLLLFYLKSAPDPCGCRGEERGDLRVSPVRQPCIAHAPPLHRPYPLPSASLLLCFPFSSFSGSRAPPVPMYSPVLPLLVPLPKHCGHPMAHAASPTLAMVPPPHTGGPATPTRLCAQWRGTSEWGSTRSCPHEPDNGRLHRPTPDPRRTPKSSNQCRGALTTVPVYHLGPLFASVCSLLTFFLIFHFGTSFFSWLVPIPPLLPPFPPFSCVPCLLV